jgi:hypothetical protein
LFYLENALHSCKDISARVKGVGYRDLDQLKASIIRKKLQGCSVTEIFTSAKISRDLFYRWWNRCQTEEESGLKEKPKGRPKTSSVEDLCFKPCFRFIYCLLKMS